MNTLMIDLAKRLTSLVSKQTATMVQSKITALKSEKNANKIRQTYDEILNTLLEERAEALTIAQAYRDELEKVEISDDDIDHLHNTVERLIEIFEKISTSDDGDQGSQELKSQIAVFEQLKDLISVDTLKTMQLLGFNYKKAIGDPLTVMMRNFILSKAPEKDNMAVFDRMITPEMVDILKNKQAYENLKDMISEDIN